MNGFHIQELPMMRAALEGRIIRTPVLALEGSKIIPLLPPDAELYMKLELFQHTGSFKARGALLGIDSLTDEQRKMVLRLSVAVTTLWRLHGRRARMVFLPRSSCQRRQIPFGSGDVRKWGQR